MVAPQTSIGADTVIMPSAGVHLAVVGDEAVLLSEREGAYFGLNEVATFVWTGLQEGLTVGAIHERLVDAYDASSDQLWDDLTRLLERLLTAGLVSARQESATG